MIIDNAPLAWQIDALNAVREVNRQNKNDALISAGTGAGKTLFGALAAIEFLKSNPNGQIIVIVPTDSLVSHWINELKPLRIVDFRTDIPADAQGYVVTYQGMGTAAYVHQKNCGNRPTMVIFDEIHHLSDQQSWGEIAKDTFKNTRFRLGLTGTAFRSKGYERISFCEYVQKGPDSFEVVPTYKITFGECVAAGYCRRPSFQGEDGPISFDCNGKPYKVRFADPLQPDLWNWRLRCATYANNNNRLIVAMIQNANLKLKELRYQQPNAGGLFIADDISHAEYSAKLFKKITGIAPIMVTSDDREAVDKIDEFRESSFPWIIAVRMISEGVNLPRLRVLIYAAGVTTELFFIQSVGRVIRIDDEYSGLSYVYYPDDPRLTQFAATIEEDIEHAIKKKREKNGGHDITPRDLRFIEAEYEQSHMTMAGQPIDPELDRAMESLRSKYPKIRQGIPMEEMLAFTKDWFDSGKRATSGGDKKPTEEPSFHEERETLLSRIEEWKRKIVPHGSPSEEYANLGAAIKRHVGVSQSERLRKATIPQLKRALDFVQALFRKKNGEPASGSTERS